MKTGLNRIYFICLFFLSLCLFFAAPPSAVRADEAEALETAQKYLDEMPFSRRALNEKLKTAGFSAEEAEYAADNCDADWNEMAVRKANEYMKTMSVSRSELIQYLESESVGFTHEQAIYAADHIGSASEDMIRVLSENLDNLFPIHGFEDDFMTVMAAKYTDIGADTAVQTVNNNGVRSVVIFANPDSVHDHNYNIQIQSGYLTNFLFTIDVVLDDIFPSGQAGCFIGYVNEYSASLGQEKLTYVYLMADGEGAILYRKTDDEDTGSFTRISDQISTRYTLTIIRFLGQTYAFINNVYAGQMNDPDSGPFALVYGASALKDGETAGCTFDNLSVRKVN